MSKGSEHFFTYEEAEELLALYRDAHVEKTYQRAEGAAIQYYLSQFLYLPNDLIGKLFGRRRWHVNQTITRMLESAEDLRLPVTMNESYREHIENIDDIARSVYGAKNKELAMVLDIKEKAYLKWTAQKVCGWYEDDDMEPEQSEMVDELLRLLGLPPGGWMAKAIMEHYRIDYHD